MTLKAGMLYRLYKYLRRPQHPTYELSSEIVRTSNFGISIYHKLGADGRTPIPCSLKDYNNWFPTSDKERVVRKSDIAGNLVSTVFEGTTVEFDETGPILFETMILDGPLSGHFSRVRTWEEAEIMHDEYCKQLRAGTFEAWARENPIVRT